jgi:hypothetical protein
MWRVHSMCGCTEESSKDKADGTSKDKLFFVECAMQNSLIAANMQKPSHSWLK